MKTALIISPHLDDAVFSCAGLMPRMAGDGWHVVVATVFTDGGEEHAQRRAEDLDAAERLGFEALHLGLRDAPFREPGYHTLRDILFGWHAADSATVCAVADALLALRIKRAPSRVFVPMGVGTHVDHRIVHEAALAVGWGSEVSFYEERPYVYARGAVERRLGQTPTAEESASYVAAWRDLPFVKLYLPPGDGAALCERLLLQNTVEAGVRCVNVSQAAVSEVVEMTAAETALCHEAARCYVSQYDAFCGGDAMHAALDARHAHEVGSASPRCERYWKGVTQLT